MANKVGDRIIRNFEFLRKLAQTKSIEKRWQLVQNATRDELLSIVEVCSNILSSDFVLTKRQKKRLVPYADFIRKLSRVKSEDSARKLVQRGEGAVLPALLIPVLIEVARSLINYD